MKNENKQLRAYRDCRPAVLLSLAVLLLAASATPYLIRRLPQLFHPAPAATLIQLTAPGHPTGLYKIEPTTTMADLYRLAGVRPPTDSGYDRDQPVAGYGAIILKNDELPLVEGTPPNLAPLVFQPIDLNRATFAQLTSINGIGATLAGRIIRYRQSHGPFHTTNELLAIKGIGPQTLQKIAPQLALR